MSIAATTELSTPPDIATTTRLFLKGRTHPSGQHDPPGLFDKREWETRPAGEVIPPNVITKPPSAELRPDQTDQDSLPPYEVLDAILYGLIERDRSVADLVAEGFDRDIVKKVEHLIHTSEWKRYQAAPGPRVSPRAFWLDRRYPLVNKWRDNG